MQAALGQFAQLQADAYTLLIGGQEFQAYMSDGVQASCPNVTTNGMFPANTPLNVVGVCNTTQTALFELSVESYMAGQDLAAPPAGTLTDPVTNQIWWSYPVDISPTVYANDSFPFYPGSPTSYASPRPTPQTLAGAPIPLVAGSPLAFGFANQSALTKLMARLHLTSTGTIASGLTSAGFTGIGSTLDGKTWQRVGVDPAVVSYTTENGWPATSNDPLKINCSFGGYPQLGGAISCTWLGQAQNSNNYFVAAKVDTVLASHYYDLTAKKVPSSSTTPATCPAVFNSSPSSDPNNIIISGSKSSSWVKYCTTDTLGLLVNTAAPAPGSTNGVAPPLLSLNQLTGPPSGGVPAITVPPPS